MLGEPSPRFRGRNSRVLANVHLEACPPFVVAGDFSSNPSSGVRHAVTPKMAAASTLFALLALARILGASILSPSLPRIDPTNP
jgi:hypothetical protein